MSNQNPQERRRDVRARITLPAAIVRRGETESVDMIDASYRGLFIRMEEGPQVRELIKLRVQLPGGEVDLHAVVMRVVDRDPNGMVGVGLRFFALNGQDRREWESFISSVLSVRSRAAA